MRRFALVLALLLAAGAAAAETADLIVVEKAARRLTLYYKGEAIHEYRIALGFAPEGDKERVGDGRTPEGRYVIDLKNDKSQFHLSLRVSYPNAADRREASALGVSPGGDIFIHGTPGVWEWVGPLHALSDWTLGCIAVTNKEIEEIWALVPIGTPIEIRP